MGTTKLRDLSFDAIKGLLILLVILGHAINIEYQEHSWDNLAFHIIYSFHMPLFIFISGMFVVSSFKKSLRTVICTKSKRLISPTIIFTCLLILLYVSSQRYVENGLGVKVLIQLTLSYWYLICIFSLSLLLYIFINGGGITRSVFLILYCVALALCYKFPIIQAIDCQIIRMLPCFSLGVAYKLWDKSNYKYSKQLSYFLLSISCIVIILNRYNYGMSLTDFPPIIRIMDGLSSCCVSFFVLKKILGRTFAKSKLLVSIGQVSLAFYLYHLIIYNYFVYNNYFQNSNIAFSIILFLMILLSSVVVYLFFSKILPDNYKFLLGI